MPARAETVLTYIAANVRRTRIRRGLTQEALAELAEIDVTYVQRVERAEVNLSINVLVALADALEVAPTRLLRRAVMPARRVGRPRKKKPAR